MPDSNNDAINAAMMNYAGQVTSSAMQSMNTNRWNKKTAAFNEKWAYQNRDWALQDWNMQNEYNTPANQRKRMIEAGINPALMYGKGPGEMTSGPIRAGAAPTANFNVPRGLDLNPGPSILTYLGIQKQTAEIDQMNIQNDLLREKIETQRGLTSLTWNKAALTQNENHKIEMWIEGARQYNEWQKREGNETTGSMYGDKMVNENLRTGQQVSNMFDENQRREIFTANNTTMTIAKVKQMAIQNAKSAAEKANLEENFKLLEKSNILQSYQIDGERFLKNIGAGAQILRMVISGK